MNCDNARVRLLGCERPDQPGDNVERHLSDCPACRGVQDRLVNMERLLKELPVPAPRPDARAALLRDIRQAPARGASAGRPTIRLLPLPGPGVREGGRRKLAVAFALAAALTVFAIGWRAWPHASVVPPSAVLVHYERQRGQRLKAPTSSERAQGLAKLAEEVFREARAASMKERRLPDLVSVYGQLVRHDLPEHARALPPKELADLAERLRSNESDASRQAATLSGKHADALRALAEHARFGERGLRALLKPERS